MMSRTAPTTTDERASPLAAAASAPMREVRRTAVYLVCALLLCIPAISPLLVDRLTCGYDNVFHLWRAVQVEHLITQGVLLSRWAPDMAHGFGLPLFVFMSPASAYPAALLHLSGLSWSLALNATFAVGIALGGVFAFLLGRDLFGEAAGLVATAAYVYAPYQAYEVFNRGSLSEALAWAFPPLVLWGLHRWVTRSDRRFLLLGAAGLCALILTHQVFAFLFAPLLGAWVVAAAIATRDRGALIRGVALGLLGLGLSAFFWLPGLVERGMVQTDSLLRTWVFDYRNNFLSFRELFSPPRVADPAMMNDWPPKAIGLIPMLLALLPLARWRWLDRTVRWQTAVLIIVLVALGGMTLAPSKALWDHLPLLEYVQFPWRFLGPAALCVALLCAAGVAPAAGPIPRKTSWWPAFAPPVILPALWVASVGWFCPNYCEPPRDTSVAGMIAWERSTDTIGSTAKGEYLPIWVDRLPDSAQVRAAYAGGKAVARLDFESLPDGARVVASQYVPTGATIDLETAELFRARYLALYYPGWRATIDGERAPIAPTHPEGLISFDVPAGYHTVRISFRQTPARWVGNGISILCAAAVAGVAGVWLLSARRRSGATLPRRSPFAAGSHVSSNLLTSPSDAAGKPWVLLIVCCLVVVARIAIVDRMATPLRRTRLVDHQLAHVDVPDGFRFGNEFVLLGHDSLPSSVASGERFEVTTYWQSAEPGGPDYGVSLSVVDSEGRQWNGGDLRVPRWHRSPPPVGQWSPDEYASIALSVPLLTGTPPGEYTVEAVAFDHKTLLPLTAYEANGEAIGPAIELGTIRIVAPSEPQLPGEMDIAGGPIASVGPLTLLDAHLDREEAAPGDQVMLSLLWEAGEVSGIDLGLSIFIRAHDGSVSARYDVPPTVTWHPTSEWQKGDVWLGQHHLRLPANIESGAHEWNLQACILSDASCTPVGPTVVVGTLLVNAPDRIFAPPPMDVTTETTLGAVATLLGVMLEPAAGPLEPGTMLTVTLVWRAEAVLDQSYRVFLHLLGNDGTPITQSDGEPVDWTRPTTGWAIGEVILDRREIEIPAATEPGAYVLRAGLYTTQHGRLLASDGDDGVTIGSLSIGGRP